MCFLFENRAALWATGDISTHARDGRATTIIICFSSPDHCDQVLHVVRSGSAIDLTQHPHRTIAQNSRQRTFLSATNAPRHLGRAQLSRSWAPARVAQATPCRVPKSGNIGRWPNDRPYNCRPQECVYDSAINDAMSNPSLRYPLVRQPLLRPSLSRMAC